MKKNVLFTMLAGIVILLIASCASAPVEAPKAVENLDTVRAAAQDSRAKALEIKANVAVPLIFSEADTTFNSAIERDTAEETEAALEGYKSSIKQFTAAFNEAKIKKDVALKSLDTADQERRTSEDVLQQMVDEQNAEEETN